MLRISPGGLVFFFLSHQQNFFKATSDIFMLIFSLQNSSVYGGGITTGYLMQLSAREHFNARQINPLLLLLQIHPSLNSARRVVSAADAALCAPEAQSVRLIIAVFISSIGRRINLSGICYLHPRALHKSYFIIMGNNEKQQSFSELVLGLNSI